MCKFREHILGCLERAIGMQNIRCMDWMERLRPIHAFVLFVFPMWIGRLVFVRTNFNSISLAYRRFLHSMFGHADNSLSGTDGDASYVKVNI